MNTATNDVTIVITSRSSKPYEDNFAASRHIVDKTRLQASALQADTVWRSTAAACRYVSVGVKPAYGSADIC